MEDLAGKITKVALNCTDMDVIEEIKLGDPQWENELLFFIKPEVFFLEEVEKTKAVVQFILDSLEKFNSKIDGIYAINGSFLDRNNIMAKHYGYINVVSNSASKFLDEDLRKKIEEAYHLAPNSYEILGGHEYLKQFKMTPFELDTFWLEEKSIKIRSGVYTRNFKINNRNIVLVNGFHPKQLAYFIDNTHRIVLMLIHSNTDWSSLKNEMVGATFPEKAVPSSIRGTLYSNAKEYGFESVGIINNCVHLSAGPFEGMAEIVNFFGKIANLDIKKDQPLMLEKMLADEIPFDKAIKALDNPVSDYNGKSTDLFTATEEMDSSKAIPIYKSSYI